MSIFNKKRMTIEEEIAKSRRVQSRLNTFSLYWNSIFGTLFIVLALLQIWDNGHGVAIWKTATYTIGIVLLLGAKRNWNYLRSPTPICGDCGKPDEHRRGSKVVILDGNANTNLISTLWICRLCQISLGILPSGKGHE